MISILWKKMFHFKINSDLLLYDFFYSYNNLKITISYRVLISFYSFFLYCFYIIIFNIVFNIVNAMSYDLMSVIQCDLFVVVQRIHVCDSAILSPLNIANITMIVHHLPNRKMINVRFIFKQKAK